MSTNYSPQQKKAGNIFFGYELFERILLEDEEAEKKKNTPPAAPTVVFENGAFKFGQVEAGQKQGGVSRASDFLGKPQPKKKVGFAEALGGHVRTLGMVNRR